MPPFLLPGVFMYMDLIQQLIQKFWSGETSEEENQLLLRLLAEQKHALSEADKAVFFKIKENGTVFVDAERSRSVLERMHAQMVPAAPAKVVSIKRNRIWWAAASVIALLGLAIYLFNTPGSEKSITVQDNSRPANRQLKTITNHTDTVMVVALQDGFVVNINGHSAVAFYEPFDDSARNISLTGEAMFKVAKDVQRPFTVYANGIATTALGTVFTVSTQQPNTVSVKLFEGKVVVRSADTSNTFMMERVYLVPGQEVTINKLTNKYLVKTNDAADMASGSSGTEKRKAINVTLSFNNEPLALVFHKLEERYGVKIQFNEKDISGLYFSGNVLKDDSLKIVLSAICNSNQLSFSREQDHIEIHNQQ